jgi:hypothetical protein
MTWSIQVTSPATGRVSDLWRRRQGILDRSHRTNRLETLVVRFLLRVHEPQCQEPYRTHLRFDKNRVGSRAGVGPCMQKERENLTLGCRFNAVDAFEVRPIKALTAFFSSSGAPPRNALRIRSFVRICLILVDLRSISRRNFLRGSASGCHSPPPFPCQQTRLTGIRISKMTKTKVR